MKSILKEIQSGKFAREWVKEYQDGLPKYNKLLEDGEKHPIEVTGRHLRSLMPWIPKRISREPKPLTVDFNFFIFLKGAGKVLLFRLPLSDVRLTPKIILATRRAPCPQAGRIGILRS